MCCGGFRQSGPVAKKRLWLGGGHWHHRLSGTCTASVHRPDAVDATEQQSDRERESSETGACVKYVAG